MNQIKHAKKDMLNAFLPSYIIPWAVFALAAFLFSFIEFGTKGSFIDFLMNVGFLFTGMILILVSFAMFVDGFSFKMTGPVNISAIETVIELPALTNFRDNSEFYVPVLNRELLVIRNEYESVDFDETMDNIGLSCKLIDENDREISCRTSCFDSKNFTITITADKREDLKKARKMILTSKKNLSTEITYSNNVRF